MDPQDSDFVDDIVDDKLSQHIDPPRKTFLPWHRVRKEFIRRNQWNFLAKKMAERHWKTLDKAQALESVSSDDSEAATPSITAKAITFERPLKCLVIPGEDLLDIRALWRDTKDIGCHIRYLGFNESHSSSMAGTRLHVANNMVTSLPRIAADSYVTHDSFESIAKTTSRAYKYLKDYGPYHIVNLDFCGSIYPSQNSSSSNFLTAIHQLLTYQFSEQRTQWLLLITTEAEPAITDISAMNKLCGATTNNLKVHADFEGELSKLFPDNTIDTQQTIKLSDLSPEHLITLFGVAFGKWLLHLCYAGQPKWALHMRRSYRYAINPEKGAIMLSLAFELHPIIQPPVDATGNSNAQVIPKNSPSEVDCALCLLKRISDIRDVDAFLNENTLERESLLNSHATLLHDAGYDKEAYIDWVKNGEK